MVKGSRVQHRARMEQLKGTCSRTESARTESALLCSEGVSLVSCPECSDSQTAYTLLLCTLPSNVPPSGYELSLSIGRLWHCAQDTPRASLAKLPTLLSERLLALRLYVSEFQGHTCSLP